MVAVSNLLASPQFASVFTYDIGASDPSHRGTIKGSVELKDGTIHSQKKGVPISDTRVPNGNSFVQALANQSAQYINSQALQKDPVKKIIIAVPTKPWTETTTQPDRFEYSLSTFANILSDSGPFNGIRFDQYLDHVKSNSNVGTISKNVQLLVVNDMMGGATEVAQQLIQTKVLSPGGRAVFMMTGGGYGFASIEYTRRNTVIIRNIELGNFKYQADQGGLEQEGASVHALARLFGESLVKQNKVTLTEWENICENAGDSLGQLITEFTDSHPLKSKLTSDEYIKTAYSAINAYLNQVALGISIHRSLGDNTIVLSGPVATGVKKWLTQYQTNPHVLSKESTIKIGLEEDVDWKTLHTMHAKDPLADALLARLWVSYSNPTTKSFMFNQNKTECTFKLITDLGVSSNAKGALLLQHAKPIGPDGALTTALEIPVTKLLAKQAQ